MRALSMLIGDGIDISYPGIRVTLNLLRVKRIEYAKSNRSGLFLRSDPR